jgi:2Fe-2S ferredoxin
MPRVTYIEFNGTEHSVEANSGDSLMETAVSNEVPGIDADCGGGCACATCHVYVDDAWLAQTGEASPMEISMLQLAEGVDGNSRLSCQISLSESLDGLVVKMPESQH